MAAQALAHPAEKPLVRCQQSEELQQPALAEQAHRAEAAKAAESRAPEATGRHGYQPKRQCLLFWFVKITCFEFQMGKPLKLCDLVRWSGVTWPPDKVLVSCTVLGQGH